jgi:formate dehydrogenase
MNDSDIAQRTIHPGSGRRRGAATPKGRQIDPAALEEIQMLLSHRPRQRDLLIEHLHLIQDRYGCLKAAHLAALAHEMRLSLTEVYEVATFYAHFDVVLEGESPPPPLTIRVCDSLTCELMGAQKLLGELKSRAGANVRVVRAPCVGRCDLAPTAEVGHHFVDHASADSVLKAAAAGETHEQRPESESLEAYRAGGGYKLLAECQNGARKPDDLIALMESAGLRGLGGAGFPSGRKWRFVRQEPGPRLMAINADEGEPGTFKDRFSGAIAAPDPGRHADRRLGRGGGRCLFLSAR